MTEWIAWTKCPACGYSDKDVFEQPDDTSADDGRASVRCPSCGNPAGYIIFPAFEIETIEISPPSAMYDTIDDW